MAGTSPAMTTFGSAQVKNLAMGGDQLAFALGRLTQTAND
jgi:hypothetical protein